VVLPFFGGVMGDKLGLRLAALLLVTLVVIGNVIVAVAPMKVLALSDDSIFYSMVVGRAIFGAGAESLNVTQIAMVTEWFRDSKIMAMAFALTISMSRLGDFLSLISGQKIADYFGGFDYTLMTAAALSGVSMLAVIAYFVIDKYSRTRYYRKYLTPEPFGWENFRCVLRFEARFWLVSLCCMTYYAGVSPFVGMLSGWLSNKYGYKASDAGALSSVVILASMVLSPFLGKAVDLIGRRPLVVALGSLLVLPSHLVLAYTGPDYAFTVFPLWPIIAVGLSFSIVPSALWRDDGSAERRLDGCQLSRQLAASALRRRERHAVLRRCRCAWSNSGT
jgi:MFS family permease